MFCFFFCFSISRNEYVTSKIVNGAKKYSLFYNFENVDPKEKEFFINSTKNQNSVIENAEKLIEKANNGVPEAQFIIAEHLLFNPDSKNSTKFANISVKQLINKCERNLDLCKDLKIFCLSEGVEFEKNEEISYLLLQEHDSLLSNLAKAKLDVSNSNLDLVNESAKIYFPFVLEKQLEKATSSIKYMKIYEFSIYGDELDTYIEEQQNLEKLDKKCLRKNAEIVYLNSSLASYEKECANASIVVKMNLAAGLLTLNRTKEATEFSAKHSLYVQKGLDIGLYTQEVKNLAVLCFINPIYYAMDGFKYKVLAPRVSTINTLYKFLEKTMMDINNNTALFWAFHGSPAAGLMRNDTLTGLQAIALNEVNDDIRSKALLKLAFKENKTNRIAAALLDLHELNPNLIFWKVLYIIRVGIAEEHSLEIFDDILIVSLLFVLVNFLCILLRKRAEFNDEIIE